MSTTEQPTRTLSDYLAIIRRRLLLIVLVAAVTIGAAGAYTLRQPVLYRSSMKLFVGQNNSLVPGFGNVADEFTQTMSDLLASNEVANLVISNLALKITPNQLLSNLHVTTKPSVAVLQVVYDDSDQKRGTVILKTVGSVFTTLVRERLAGTDAKESSQTVTATVFDQAHPLPGKVQPKPVRNMGVALVLGVLLGLLVAVLREQFDDTIRSVEEAERAFGQVSTTTLPPGVVGFRPFDRTFRLSKKADPLITELSLQKLRASILWAPESGEARTLLITSANPEEGKTTITSNLAVLMVTEGRNVIVVEGDLRHPVLHRYLGMPVPTENRGFDAVMRGEVSVRDALVEIPVPAMAFSSFQNDDHGLSGGAYRNEAPAPGRLRAILATPGRTRPGEYPLGRAAQVIEELRQQAEFVIFDSAPILVVPDAYPLVAVTDTTIAVVRGGKTSAKAAAALSRILERLRARRVDLVVSDAEPTFAQTYYYGYTRPSSSQSAPDNGSRNGSSRTTSDTPGSPSRTIRRR